MQTQEKKTIYKIKKYKAINKDTDNSTVKIKRKKKKLNYIRENDNDNNNKGVTKQ